MLGTNERLRYSCPFNLLVDYQFSCSAHLSLATEAALALVNSWTYEQSRGKSKVAREHARKECEGGGRAVLILSLGT